ncbi:MAG: hypothetical protein DHS20C01_15800 [marine bacterium B5-7]|nr:MAG: hypothetical protein DHS20C01_15800 [marine bacterium B5-7]
MVDGKEINRDLHRVFMSTRYTVMLDGQTCDIRIGEKLPPALEDFLHRVGQSNWIYVTAWNPDSRQLSLDENRSAQARLRRSVGYSELVLDGIGIGHDGWKEESLFVAGVTLDQAATLGLEFEQLCVVVGETGNPAKLLYCDSKLTFQ